MPVRGMAPSLRALLGCRVLLTRPAHRSAPAREALELAGAEVLEAPAIRIVPPEDPAILESAARRLRRGEVDWAIVTSANGAEALAGALSRAAQVASGQEELRVRSCLCAVGPATAGVLEEAGYRVACVPERPEAAAIPQALARASSHGGSCPAAGPTGGESLEPAHALSGVRVLIVAGDRADVALARQLAALGARVERVTAYRTLDDPEGAALAAGLVLAGGADVMVVASPSAVGAVRSRLPAWPARARVVAIGPTTARAAREAGWPVEMAASPTPRGLVEAAVRAWEAIRAAAT